MCYQLRISGLISTCLGSALFDLKKALAIFNRLAIFDENFHNGTLGFRLNLIHNLHRFNDAHNGIFDNFRSDIDERLAFW